jgi:hypothetical protein
MIPASSGMTLDLWAFLGELAARLWLEGTQEFFITLGVGALLGAFTWWLARYVALSFNRHFAFKAQYHAFCALAAGLTIVFALLFVSLRYTGSAAREIVDDWEVSLGQNPAWAESTFRKAYDAVYALRDADGNQLEDFTSHPHPEMGKATLIPTNTDEAKRTAAEIYASEAVDSFRVNHPLLSAILWAKSESAQGTIFADMDRFFKATGGGGRYRAEDAIGLAGNEIQRELAKQVPRVVLITRSVLVVLFLIVQTIIFGLLIRSALADIKESPVPKLRGR